MDMLFYMYCIKMRRGEQEFYNSSIRKITKMIEMYADECRASAAAIKGEPYESEYFGEKREVVEVASMKDII